MKPMLACSLNIKDEKQLKKLRFPLLVSPKLDGIRFVIDAKGNAVTRSLKPIRNTHIRKHLEMLPPGTDGEIGAIPEEIADKMPWVEVLTAISVPQMNFTSSAVMSTDGEPYFRAHIFDNALVTGNFPERMEHIEMALETVHNQSDLFFVQWVPQIEVTSLEGLLESYGKFMEGAYEGLMARNPNALYKYGRSAMRDQALLKVKLMERDEAAVTGWEEEMHNSGEAKRNATGGLERTSHRAQMVPKGRVGALKVTHKVYGEFKIYGFTDELKADLWTNRTSLSGKLLTFEFFPYGMARLDGEQPKPRFPRFVAFRDLDDL